MLNNEYVSLNVSDKWRSERAVHYRHYLDKDFRPVVICVQDFDYNDYHNNRFLNEYGWFDEQEAEDALYRMYRNGLETDASTEPDSLLYHILRQQEDILERMKKLEKHLGIGD